MKETKEGKNKKILVIALIFVVVIAIIVFFVMRNSDNNNNNVNSAGINSTSGQGKTDQEQFSLMDMNNVENVKIKDGVKENNSEALLKDKTFSNMKVTNIRLFAEKGLTNFTAKVENNTKTDFKERKITIVFTNKDGSEYARLEGFLSDIKAGESNMIDASTTADLSNAYDFTIE